MEVRKSVTSLYHLQDVVNVENSFGGSACGFLWWRSADRWFQASWRTKHRSCGVSLPQTRLSLCGIPDLIEGWGPHHDFHNFLLFFMQKIECNQAPSWCYFMADKYLPVFINTFDTINPEQISHSPAASLLHQTSYIFSWVAWPCFHVGFLASILLRRPLLPSCLWAHAHSLDSHCSSSS